MLSKTTAAWRLSDWRSLALAAALLGIALTLVVPRITMQRPTYNVMAFIDITGSMKVRDMGSPAAPVERLEAAKSALRTLLGELPCRSRLGLGIFTERRAFVLFDPVEVCDNFDPIHQSISNIDWRMGWEGDSFVSSGVHHAIAETEPLDADLLFLTDGQEAPPLPPGAGIPPFEGEPGKVKGVIVGVGGKDKVPIPKFDSDGNETGVYSEQEVVQENRTGPPPPDAEKRPGYHPKWAPFGSDPPTGDEQLSSVHSAHLSALAAQTGLAYAGLKENPDLLPVIAGVARPHPTSIDVDVRPWPATLALLLLTAVYTVPLAARAILGFFPFKTGSRS